MRSCVVRAVRNIYKILIVPIPLTVAHKVGDKTPLFHSHSNNLKLKCPYKGCEKSFEKPTILTDQSTIPRQSYYACPHCMSKLDITIDNMKIVSVKPAEYPRVFESPAKCAHFSSLLNARPHNAPLPEECLLCPKVLQCSIRKK